MSDEDKSPRLPPTSGKKQDGNKTTRAEKPPIDNKNGYLNASPSLLAQAYDGFKNLEDLKTAIADGFPPESAILLETEEGMGRKEYLGYLRNVLDSLTDQTEPERKLRSAAEVAEDKYADITGSVLVDMLRREQTGGNILSQKERSENPAIPNDPGFIAEWPRELIYKWVPAPPKHRNFSPDESTNLEAHIRKGWRFYSPSLMRDSPNMRGLPWKLGWEAEGEKVRWQDQWLMLRFRDQEMHDRIAAIKRNQERGQQRTTPGTHRAIDSRGDEYAYVVHSTGGESTVDKVLREKPDSLDALDNEFPGT